MPPPSPRICPCNPAPKRAAARRRAQKRATPRTPTPRRTLQSPFSRTNRIDAKHTTTPARRAAIPILLALCSAATAHPILINSGTLDISPTAITARFPISPHDLEHAGLNPDNPDAITDFADDLADSLAILTPQGERLTVKSVGVEPGAIEHEARKPPTGVIAFDPPEQRTHLTFQQRPSPDGPPIRRQLQLTVRPAQPEAADPVNLRLTSDGNVETICVAQDDSCATFDREALTSIHLFINADASPPTIRSEMPAHLLATWRPFTLQHTDVITLDESASMNAPIAVWAERQAALTLDDQASPLHTVRIEWLLPDGSNPTSNFGYWSARIAVTLAPASPATFERAEFTWRGFNSAVMTAESHLSFDGEVQNRRFLPGDATSQWTAAPATPGKEAASP